MTKLLQSYCLGKWFATPEPNYEVHCAVTGRLVASGGTSGIDFSSVLDYARNTGGPALRRMTFHERALAVKDLAKAIMARKEELYELSRETGATRGDSWIDIEGGAGTLFTMSSKARRELPDDVVFLDGEMEPIGKTGQFVGHHIYSSLQGAGILINAFNFPVWGMLEKLGPALIAGVPVIIKPAMQSAQVAEHAFRIMLEAGVLPEGALQLLVGDVGDLLDHLSCQDVVSFTGSAATAMKLQANPVIARESVRFIAERDSLNASVLGPDSGPGTPEFNLFVKEVVREMTTKAGQKCTAIRRALVPAEWIDEVQDALCQRLSRIVVGDPATEGVTMGALISAKQAEDVRAKARKLAAESSLVYGDIDAVSLQGDDVVPDAFVGPLLFRNDAPAKANYAHSLEAFGPVATLMPYRDAQALAELARMGEGSLVISVFSYDPQFIRNFVLEAGAFHGRIVILDRDSAPESTGHGSPLPMLVHGGPGRAGGSEELGGVRAVKHFMLRSAVQGHPRQLSRLARTWLPGAPQEEGPVHPFRKRMSELDIGYTLKTDSREITLEDIEHFAHFTGDTFYAHMDEVAAAASPIFGGRVAHGYLILAFAAGLFVDPAPGPVLANFGLERLRFIKPVSPGESIKVALTVKSKSVRTPEMGEVRWSVAVTDSQDELVASYELLTMNTP